MKVKPPRVARAIMTLLTSSVERAYVLGDLWEEYEVLLRERGEVRANDWYRRQVLRSIAPLAVRRVTSWWPRLSSVMRMRISETLLDAHQGLRVAVRTPLITVAIIATMALSIGAITSTWVVVDGVLLRKLPFREAERLMYIVSGRNGDRVEVSLPTLESWRAQARTLSAVGGYATSAVTLGDGSFPERVRAAVVTEGFAELLGVQPVAGRGFSAADHGAPAPRVALLGHDLWRRRYGGDGSVIGRMLEIDEQPVQVVGVLPDFGFAHPRRGGDVWLPVQASPGSWQASRRTQWLSVLAVQRADASSDDVVRELSSLTPRRGDRARDNNARYSVRFVREEIVGAARPTLNVLGVAMLMVLLIACGNLVMLLTVWGQKRRSEYALRTVLGGGGGRIRRQLLTETLMLGLAGGTLGLLLAQEAVSLLLALYPGGLPRAAGVSVDARATFVAMATALSLSTVFALPSILRTMRRDVGSVSQGGWATPSRKERRARSMLVVGQLAMSAALLSGGTLLVKRFWQVARVDPGFRTTGVLTFHVQPSETKYLTDASIDRFYVQLVDSLRAIPGVEAAGTVSYLPFRGAAESERVRAAGGNAQRGSRADVRAVRGFYFQVMSARLVQGRWFATDGSDDRNRVAVINAALADRLFREDNAVGQRIVLDDRTWSVIGVVGNMRTRQLSERPRGEVYLPGTRAEESAAAVVVRAAGNPSDILPAIQSTVRRLDTGLALADIATMDTRIRDSIATQRFQAALLGGLSAFALLLAATGIYGLVAYTVSQQRREIGIRMALGEPARAISRRVLLRALALSATGLALGAVLAIAGMEWFASAVTDLHERDAGILLQVPLLLLLVTLVAAWSPALRAGRVDPMITMRE